VETQLRDYQIRPGHMDDWIAGWRSSVVPLRTRAGFVVLGAWVDRPHDRFVWVVGYEGADGFEAADARYHAMPERLSVEPEPSDFIAQASLDMVSAAL
jgi:NIPSNAP